jgi:yecA family protein
MYASLSQADIADLTRFLADPLRPEGTLTFHEVQGFLFAVACSPELVPPSAWLPAISDDEDIGFENEAEAQRIMGLIIGLYNGINDSAVERSGDLPPGCKFRANVEDNFDEELPISLWSQGFMTGHDWLAEVWDEHLPAELDGEVGSTAMVLTFFSSRQLAELYYLESTTTPRHRRPKVSFIEYAEKVRELFPAAMSSYAHIGRSISEALIDSEYQDD